MRQQISSTPTYDMQVWMPHNRLGTGKAEKILYSKMNPSSWLLKRRLNVVKTTFSRENVLVKSTFKR